MKIFLNNNDASTILNDEKKFSEFMRLQSSLSITDKMSFVKCWFKNVEIECSKITHTGLINNDHYNFQNSFIININPNIFESFLSTSGNIFCFNTILIHTVYTLSLFKDLTTWKMAK